MKKDKSKEDLLVTDLGLIEPLYNEFDGKMYGALQTTTMWQVTSLDLATTSLSLTVQLLPVLDFLLLSFQTTNHHHVSRNASQQS
jgi:hypothetical protein